ncbi:MAG: hypothetical protein ACFE85_10950 [Candidatus Hodarchaeota archaeon]
MPQDSQILKKLGYIINALDQFPEKHNSLFNVSKLALMLQLSKEQIDQILKIIFKLQTQLTTIFKEYRIQKVWKNGIIYLTLIPKERFKNNSRFLKEISFTTLHSNLLNDIIYYFEHVKIGKGFNVHKNGTELSQKVKELNNAHPYLFESRGNGLIYPSKLAIEIGRQFHSYNKSNREISQLQIEDYNIIVQ